MIFNLGREFDWEVPRCQLLFQNGAKFRKWMLHVFALRSDDAEIA
jgi:hypothetical protein